VSTGYKYTVYTASVNMELSGWSVCVSNVIECFQEQPN